LNPAVLVLPSYCPSCTVHTYQYYRGYAITPPDLRYFLRNGFEQALPLPLQSQSATST